MLDLSMNTAAAEQVPVNAVTPVVTSVVPVYPKTALDTLTLKCRLARCYLDGDEHAISSMSPGLRSGVIGTFARFEEGADVALAVAEKQTGFDQAIFDVSVSHGADPTAQAYSCAQAKADGSSVCPVNGCPLPTRAPADSPIDLLTWDCNVKSVGQAAIAQSVAASEYSGQLLSIRERLYIYKAGSYVEVTDTDLQRKVMPHLGETATVRQASEIGKLMRISHAHQIDVVKPDRNFICFNNGTLNVATQELVPHSPRHMLFNNIDHDFDPEAQCPQFLTFLDSTFQGDADSSEKIQLIQEWFGYILTADSSLQKMLILKGEGANGKSIVMDLAKHMVGSKNTHGAMLHRLKMPYVRAELEGKLLNQSADLPKIGSVADGDMKSIVSGDGVEVSPKHKPSYTITPYVRLMAATNHLPPSNDDRGLYRLRRQRVFTAPASSEAIKQAYQYEISPMKMFAQECLSHSPDRSGLLARDLFLGYRGWCRDRGFDPENMISMGRSLSAEGFNTRKSGTAIWLVKVADDAAEYFRPAQKEDLSHVVSATTVEQPELQAA